MKKCMMLMVALMISSTVIFAQHHRGDRKKHGDAAEKMKSELGLSDTQYATIKGIDEKYHTQHTALRSDSTQSKEARIEAFKNLRAEKEKEIGAVLTAEQKTKWNTQKAQEAEQREARFEKAAARHHEKLKAELKLTDDQSNKMQAVNNEFREKFMALRKTDAADSAAYQALKADHETAIKGILNEQQFQQWKTLKADAKNRH